MDTLSQLANGLGVNPFDVISYARTLGFEDLSPDTPLSAQQTTMICDWVEHGEIPRAPDSVPVPPISVADALTPNQESGIKLAGNNRPVTLRGHAHGEFSADGLFTEVGSSLTLPRGVTVTLNGVRYEEWGPAHWLEVGVEKSVFDQKLTIGLRAQGYYDPEGAYKALNLEMTRELGPVSIGLWVGPTNTSRLDWGIRFNADTSNDQFFLPDEVNFEFGRMVGFDHIVGAVTFNLAKVRDQHLDLELLYEQDAPWCRARTGLSLPILELGASSSIRLGGGGQFNPGVGYGGYFSLDINF
ncbi:MAG: hypothetical protein A2289_20580 [Deltaproteobacteria bacterium RIFOXYA12_FULL_58_15]|nr:MAG: hypothetical protein A2289_20580 [Deltaproteobacteria bacterium RIFOXYA12_FULL_58_15]